MRQTSCSVIHAGRARRSGRTAGSCAGPARAAGRARPRRHSGQQARGRRRAPRAGVSAWSGCGGGPTAGPARARCLPIRRITARPRLVRGSRGPALQSPVPRGAAGIAPATGCWRDDHLYDFVIEIDHNTRPRVAGRGSAVFIHVARAGFAPTAGCIALRTARPAAAACPAGPKNANFSSVVNSRFISLLVTCRRGPLAENRAADAHMGGAEADRDGEIRAHPHRQKAAARCGARSWRSGRNAAPAPRRPAGCTSARRSASP